MLEGDYQTRRHRVWPSEYGSLLSSRQSCAVLPGFQLEPRKYFYAMEMLMRVCVRATLSAIEPSVADRGNEIVLRTTVGRTWPKIWDDFSWA